MYHSVYMIPNGPSPFHVEHFRGDENQACKEESDASDVEGFVYHMPQTRNGWPLHSETESPQGLDPNDPLYKFLGPDDPCYGFGLAKEEENEHDGFSGEEVDDDDDDDDHSSIEGLKGFYIGGRYFSRACRLESDSGSDVPDDEPAGDDVYPDPETDDLDGEPCI